MNIVDVYLEQLHLNEKNIPKLSAKALERIKQARKAALSTPKKKVRKPNKTNQLINKLTGKTAADAEKFSSVNQSAYNKIKAQKMKTAAVRRSLAHT